MSLGSLTEKDIKGAIDEAAAEAAAACAALSQGGNHGDEAAAAVEAYLATAPGTNTGGGADDRGGAGAKRKAATTPAASRKATKGATGASGGGASGGGGGSSRKPASKAKAAAPTQHQPTTRHTKAEVPETAAGSRSAQGPKRPGPPKESTEAWEFALKLLKDMRVPKAAMSEFYTALDKLEVELLPERSGEGAAVPAPGAAPAVKEEAKGLLASTAPAAAPAPSAAVKPDPDGVKTQAAPAAPAAPAPAAPAPGGGVAPGGALKSEPGAVPPTPAQRQASTEHGPEQWLLSLVTLLRRLRSLHKMSESLNFGELQAVLQGAFVGYLNRLKPLTLVRELTKAEIVRSNLAHAAVSRALSIRADLEAHLGKIMLKATAGQRLDHPPEPGLAAKLRSSLTRLMKTGRNREYEVMTKEHYNSLIGQKRLWVAGEREALLDALCTRDGKLMITRDYFFQHTNKSHAELYVIVHIPTMQIHALAAMADFHTPWTAGQFHHMVHSSQEDRMFFFGRRSEASLMPRVLYDPNSSFEGGTRWSAHFHMPALLAIDIVGVRPGCRGLAIVLMAHISCLQSSFLKERTHLLFDISGRESNTRMIRFTQSIGAWRSQTFSDEARSEGFIGVEGDDPSIYWASKQGDGYTSKAEAEKSTAGVYAMDSKGSQPIGPNHPAVLFDDRVTQQDFGKGGRNCSYFAIAPIEVAQQRLIDCVDELQREFATEAEKAEAANGTESKPKPWAAAAR